MMFPCFTILSDGRKADTILSEGRYPENDNEIMVSRIFESTIKRSKGKSGLTMNSSKNSSLEIPLEK